MKLLKTIVLALLIYAPSVTAADDGGGRFVTVGKFTRICEGKDEYGKVTGNFFAEGAIESWVLSEFLTHGDSAEGKRAHWCANGYTPDKMAHTLIGLGRPDEQSAAAVIMELLRACSEVGWILQEQGRSLTPDLFTTP